MLAVRLPKSTMPMVPLQRLQPRLRPAGGLLAVPLLLCLLVLLLMHAAVSVDARRVPEETDDVSVAVTAEQSKVVRPPALEVNRSEESALNLSTTTSEDGLASCESLPDSSSEPCHDRRMLQDYGTPSHDNNPKPGGPP